MISGAQPSHPAGRNLVRDEKRPVWFRRWMPNIHDGKIADFIPSEQMSATKTTERDGDIRPRGPMHDARKEVHAGWTVDSDDRNLQVMDAAK
jgi:hypothetical protein